MSEIGEVVLRVLFRIVAQFVINVAANIALSLTFLFFRRTGDFVIEVVTLDYFRDHSNVALHKKPVNPVADWAAALLGLFFWCAFAAAAYLSWPWLASL